MNSYLRGTHGVVFAARGLRLNANRPWTPPREAARLDRENLRGDPRAIAVLSRQPLVYSVAKAISRRFDCSDPMRRSDELKNVRGRMFKRISRDAR